jgi:hypothetical protein
MVVVWVPDVLGERDGDAYEIRVDPGFPSRWREEPWHSDLQTLSLAGIKRERRYHVRVFVGDRVWLVLPNQDIEAGEGAPAGVVMQTGENEFQLIRCKDAEGAKQMLSRMQEVMEWASRLPPELKMQMRMEIEEAQEAMIGRTR